MQPSFAKGYLGQKQINIGPDTLLFNAFKHFNINNLDINNARITLDINNEIGMNAALVLQQITSINTNTGKSIELNTSSMPSSLEIGSATSYDPLIPEKTIFEFNDQNANPSELIGLLPNVISYSMDITTNPQGNTGTYENFMHTNKGLNIAIDAEIPLQINAGQLMLNDTVDIFTRDTSNLNAIHDGTYYLLVYNGFPLQVNINIYFLDNGHVPFDSLCFTDPVKAAPVDKVTMMVNDTAFSKLSFQANGERMEDLLNAKKVVIRATLNTKPSDNHLQLYSTYKLDIKLTADINYKLNDCFNPK